MYGSLTVVGVGTKHGFSALTQLGIQQSDWWRAGIRSTNVQTVVEYYTHACPISLNIVNMASSMIGFMILTKTKSPASVSVISTNALIALIIPFCYKNVWNKTPRIEMVFFLSRQPKASCINDISQFTTDGCLTN